MHQKKTWNSWKILDKKYSAVVISTPRFPSWQTSGNLPQALQLIQAVGTCWRLFPFIRLAGSSSFSSKLYMELAVASSTTPHLNGQNLGALMLKHVKCKGIKLLYTKSGLDPSAYTRIHTQKFLSFLEALKPGLDPSVYTRIHTEKVLSFLEALTYNMFSCSFHSLSDSYLAQCFFDPSDINQSFPIFHAPIQLSHWSIPLEPQQFLGRPWPLTLGKMCGSGD